MEQYKEKLEEAKKLYESANDDQKHVLESLFPELKESEDEKMWKLIKKYAHYNISDMVFDADHITREQLESWLEKQCESNPYSGTSFKYNGHTFNMSAKDNGVEILLDGEFKAFVSLEKTFVYPTHYIPSLDQSSIILKSAMEAAKEEKVDNANKVEPKDYNSIDPHFFKTTDKVESKFKVGDFIVNDYCSGKVIKITDDAYLLDTGQDIPFSCEHNAHLWNVTKDAKDGDVLVVPPIKGSEHSEQIFIFKEIKDREYVKNAVEYYCRCMDNEFAVNERSFMGQSDDYFTPATKEQRDFLFQKMKEAGYEWDNVKKVLIRRLNRNRKIKL